MQRVKKSDEMHWQNWCSEMRFRMHDYDILAQIKKDDRYNSGFSLISPDAEGSISLRDFKVLVLYEYFLNFTMNIFM